MIWPTKKLGELFEPIFNNVEEDVIDLISKGDFKEEDHITGTVLTRIEERINNHSFNDLQVCVRQFSGRGPNSEESLTGADGAFIIDAPNLEIRKFFIFQSKVFKSSSSKFDEHAIEQKWRMLACTPDSFFLIYTKANFQFISAFLPGLNDKLFNLPTKSFSEFYQDFFNCFIGDHFFGFPRRPFPHPWRFWPFEGYPDYPKLTKDLPLAKKNLLIQIERYEETG